MIRCQITGGNIPPSPTATFVQFRNASLSARDLTIAVRNLMQRAPCVLVNDRIDVALATGAAGVHMKSHGISPRLVRRLAPSGFLITVACHSEEDVVAAEGADYALLSPIFSPISKRDDRTPLGLRELARIAGNVKVPILALGGITHTNARSCVEAGAAGIAAVSLFAPGSD